MDVNVMVKHVIQIRSGIKNSVDVSAKSRKGSCVQKNIIFGILVHVIVNI